jgi:predicted nucleotidyltransferase
MRRAREAGPDADVGARGRYDGDVPLSPLSPLETNTLAELRRRLEGLLGDRLLRLTLFGSRARGEGDEHSDLDVLVLVRGMSAVDRRRVIDVVHDVELACGLAIGPLVRDPRWTASGAPLVDEIERDGVPL